jgi:hypothetical protein
VRKMPYLANDALVSDCGTWRYWLSRRLSMGERAIAFVGLNPSTADAVQDDPTIRREVDYARRWGFDWYFKANLYAYRSTNPDVLKTLTEPESIGPENAEALAWVTQKAELVICAWGSEPLTPAAECVAKRLMGLSHARYLKRNQDGMPAHPLYLKKTLVPLAFGGPAASPEEA